MKLSPCVGARCQVLAFTLLAATTPGAVFGQISPADAPWTGEALCVLSTRGPNYQDDQTHRWRLTGEPPKVTGSIRHWPAVWTVEGSGSRSSVRDSDAGAKAPTERWTTNVPETSAPIAIWQIPASDRLRIGSQHGLLVSNAITVKAPARQDITYTLQEWEFPVAEDLISSGTLVGSRARTLKSAAGWQHPSNAVTTETCKWRFTRDTSRSSDLSASAGSRTVNAGTSTPATIAKTTSTIETPSLATLSKETPLNPARAAGRTEAAGTRLLTTPAPGGAPVSGLRVSATLNSVSMRWSCPQGASGYEVFGAPKGQALVKLTTTPIGPNCVQDLALSPAVVGNAGQPGLTPQTTHSTGFTHSGLPTAKEFTYTVRALYANGGPADSPLFSASTSLFPAPTGASASTGGPGVVSLGWGQSYTNSGEASAYIVSRKLASESAFRAIATVPPAVSYNQSYTDNGVPAGRHEYTVRAVDGDSSPVLAVVAGLPDLWNGSVLNLMEIELGWTVWPGTPVRVMTSQLAAGPWIDVGANLAPGSTFLRFLATPGARSYYKVVATYPGVTLESTPKTVEVPQWQPLTNLRTQINGNFVDLSWDCEPGIVEYHVTRVWNGGKQYAQIPINVYPGICNLSDRGIPTQIGPSGVEYIIVGYDRLDNAVRASRVRP